MEPPLNIVIPMAGRGSRFANVGITVPKPLIDVRGKPMYAWATESLPLALATRLIFICLDEHVDRLGLAEDIKTRYARFEPVIVALHDVTRGQAETVLKAREHIDGDSALLIYNADTFERNRLQSELPALADDVVGLLNVFAGRGDKWSFARTDSQGRVLETAEKRRIGPHASTGLYWFKHGHDFVRLAERAIRDDERASGEFYVAPLYNQLIAEGGHVRLHHVDEVWPLGTPEDLSEFERAYSSVRES